MVVAVLSLAAMAGAGCGSTTVSQDGGTGGSGGGGTTGTGGASGAAGSGTGGAGGGGGSSAACPASPPTSGATCSGTQTCFYEDCTDTGRTVARCANGGWSLETGPCTTVACQGQTCPSGQLCVQRIGGALIVDCVQNTCGVGAIGCGCLQSCVGTCTAGGSLQTGVTIQCNTCPTNTCP
jgi:hypothetical protein